MTTPYLPVSDQWNLYGESNTSDGYVTWSGYAFGDDLVDAKKNAARVAVKAAAQLLEEALPWTKTSERLPEEDEYDFNEEIFWQYGGFVTRKDKHDVEFIKRDDPEFLKHCWWRPTGFTLPKPYEPDVLPT